jgi:redox-sensitive bicupin YhaK (pirin superfamily)
MIKRAQFLSLCMAAAGGSCANSKPTSSKPMKLTIRKSNERGRANHGWLDSYHTFSFANYYDPRHMGFRSLRVINQDVIAPGAGFPTHPHNDMEIFSYILRGALEHKDSMGNGRVLRPGQIQMMSAGSGVTHSEFNPSRTEDASLLQIWIRPSKRGLTPSYTEWHPDPAREKDPKVLVISQDGREGSATIHQDASIYRLRIPAGQTVTHELAPGRGAWLQLIHGEVTANDIALSPGDAVSTDDAGLLSFTASSDAEALLFDLK